MSMQRYWASQWNWAWIQKGPQEILDSSKTISTTGNILEINLVPQWPEPRVYLQWAEAALRAGGDSGWDSAAGWAKRAVCRRMDGFLVQRHLRYFLGKNYGEKAGLLARMGIPGLQSVRELVISAKRY
jgi:hypothetical protein